MKANELQIGDYVNYRGQIIKVTSLYDKGGSNEVGWSDKEDVWVNADNVKPIPLTPEILEKNGFVIKKKWAQIGNFGDSPLIMWHFEDDAILHDFKHELEIHQNDTGKVHVRIPCEYVHELQAALRLCGIEKEIVL